MEQSLRPYLLGTISLGGATILRNFNGATAVAMRVPEATKKGFCEIDRGGAWISRSRTPRREEEERWKISQIA